jgi:surface carbohydrate biosynthesis protein
MRRRRVALILDHPQRDLPGLVLLARELCRRGAICHLVPLNSQEGELFALAPDFVLLNFTRVGTEGLAGRLLAAGIELGLGDTEGAYVSARDMHEEGATRASFEDYTGLLWRDPSLLKRISVACMWGPLLAEHLASGGWFAREQLEVTGCPRFDLYHPRWRSVFGGGPGGGPAAPRRILINTWYSIANPRLVPVSDNERQLRNIYRWPEERIRVYLDTERRAVQGCIEVARRLAHDYPDVEILLRPHPFESDEIYRSGLAGLANVRVDCSGPVYPQIFRSSVLVTRGCTTAVEAALAGLPALSPQWVPTPFVNPISESVSIPCSDYKALRESVGEIIAGRFQASPALAERVDRVVSEWFYRNDGLAHIRVADAVLARLAGPRRVNEELCAGFLRAYQSERRHGMSLHHVARRFFGLPSGWSFRRFRVVPSPPVKYFGVSHVQHLVERLALASGTPADPTAELNIRLDDGAPSAQENGAARSVTLASSSAGAGAWS